MNIKKKLGIVALFLTFLGISVTAGQEISDISTEIADFDVQNAMMDIQSLKANLDELIEELYSLDEQER